MSGRFQILQGRANVDSRDIEALLHRVYVGAKFTAPALAEASFAAAAVFERGRVLVARDPTSGALAGMVIVVPPTSPARTLAAGDEVEMHLLAVAPEFRGFGLGGELVKVALEFARRDGFRKMILWTQPTMTDAHRLYERHGFSRVNDRDFESGGRDFLVFERKIDK